MIIDPYEVRDIAAAYVDKYFAELDDRLLKGDKNTIDETIIIIREIKSLRLTAFGDVDDLTDWLKTMVKEHKESFSMFVSQGQEFLEFHVRCRYGDEAIPELRNTLSRLITSTNVPVNSVEWHAPVSNKLDWMQGFQSYPWMLFVLILRITYIDMGEEEKPSNHPVQGSA